MLEYSSDGDSDKHEDQRLNGDRIPHVGQHEREGRRDVGDQQRWQHHRGTPPPRQPHSHQRQQQQHDRNHKCRAIHSSASRKLMRRVGIVAALDEEHANRAIQHA